MDGFFLEILEPGIRWLFSDPGSDDQFFLDPSSTRNDRSMLFFHPNKSQRTQNFTLFKKTSTRVTVDKPRTEAPFITKTGTKTYDIGIDAEFVPPSFITSNVDLVTTCKSAAHREACPESRRPCRSHRA